MTGSAKKGDVETVPTASNRNNRQGAHDPALDRVTQSYIGDRLRSMYGELVEQPVPDRLADLLRQLDAKA